MNGRLIETRFQTLSDDYQREQADLRVTIEKLSKEITGQENQATNVGRLIRLVRKHLSLAKLTTTALNDPVNAGYVHAPDKSSGHRVQDITISYNRIGILLTHLLNELRKKKRPDSLRCQAVSEKVSSLSY